jgi:hypothetical protein
MNLQENIQRIKEMMKLLNENIDNSCKERANKLLPIAVNHWKNWLSHPETKQKFSKNHNYDLNKTEEIFRKYFSILENLKIVLYHGDEIEGLEKINLKIKKEIRKSSDADAFVIPVITNLIFFNCAFGDQTEEVLIHEINHILDGVHPINPWKMVYDVLYDQPKTPKNFNLNNLSKALDILGVKDENQKQKIIQKYIQIYNGDEIKKFYACDLWEKSANIQRIRKMFQIQPNQNITLNHFKPYILFENPSESDIRWFIMCWVKQGFKDLNTLVNNFNLLAKVGKSNNTFV